MKIRYFAWMREQLGHAGETITLPDDCRTVGDVIGLLRTRGGAWQTVFAVDDLIRVAVNHVHADVASPVRPDDELAFFPPMTGG